MNEDEIIQNVIKLQDANATPEDIEEYVKLASQELRAFKLEGYKQHVIDSQKEADKSLAGRFGKQVFQMLASGPARFAASAAEIPESVKNSFTPGGSASQREYKVPGLDPFKSIQSDAMPLFEDIISGNKSLPNALKPFMETIIAGAEVLGLGKGLLGDKVLTGASKGLTTQGLIPKSVGKVAGATKTFLGQRAAEKATQSAISITKPTLSKAEEEFAKTAGRVSKTGILRRTTLAPSKRDLEIADSVKDIVKKDDPFKNITRIRDSIAKTNEVVEKGLKTNNAIFNQSQLNKVLKTAKDESRVIFGSDKALESQYNAVQEEFMRQVAKKPKTLSGLLEARKAFDQVVKNKFPKVFNQIGATDAPRVNAILDIRRAANQYIADNLPAGNVFKALLRKESLMYDAIENIAKSSPKLGSTALSRIGKSHPVITGLVKYGVGAAGVGGGALYGASKALGGE